MPLILGTNSIKDTGFDVANSVRMETNTYLTGSNKVTATSNKIGSFSFWIKRSGLGTNAGGIVKVYDDANTGAYIGFKDDDTFFVEETNSGGTAIVNLITNAVYRDMSAWYHILVTFKTDDATDSNRVKLFINGTQPSLGTATYPSQNTNLLILGSSNPKHEVGVNADGASGKYYLAQLLHIDGTALSNTDTGEFDEDSNIWKPIDISETTLGNNGYFLSMEDSSNFGTATGKSFTANNLTAIDQSTDTCTNNFATLNPLNAQAGINYSEGNLFSADSDDGTHRSSFATIGVSSGKWFWEGNTIGGMRFGIINADSTILNTTGDLSADAAGYFYSINGQLFNNGSGSSYGASYTSNDKISIALNLDDNQITFYKNGASQGASSITSGLTYLPAHDSFNQFDGYQYNFGSPMYSESGGNSDGNGYGNFSMSVPSGYYALNTKNLAEYG